MSNRKGVLSRLAVLTAFLVAAVAAGFVLRWVNERMIVRYQAVGRVVDEAGAPVAGVEAVLLLGTPPPVGPRLDALFRAQGIEHERHGTDGRFKRSIGPIIGLSDHNGVYVVRGTGRTGSAHAIRFGLDDAGRPPFERAWLLLRREGHPVVMKTLSVLGWRTAPKEWGSFVNRLPLVVVP